MVVILTLAREEGGPRVRKRGGIGAYKGRTEFPCILCGYTIKKREVANHLASGECRQNQSIQRKKLENEGASRASS